MAGTIRPLSAVIDESVTLSVAYSVLCRITQDLGTRRCAPLGFVVRLARAVKFVRERSHLSYMHVQRRVKTLSCMCIDCQLRYTIAMP